MGPHLDTATDSQFIFLERIWGKKAEKLHVGKIKTREVGAMWKYGTHKNPKSEKNEINMWLKKEWHCLFFNASFLFLRHLFDI